MTTRRRSATASWWRLWTIQGSWNRQNMQNLAWLVAVSPWLRDRTTGEQRGPWLRRYRGFFNTNPYLAPLLVGFVQRFEDEGRATAAPALVTGLSRTLGSLGDGLTWTGARPAFALVAAIGAVILGAWFVLIPWLIFLVAQGWTRSWALRVGYDRALDIGAALASLPIHRVTAAFQAAAAAAVGALIVTVMVAAPDRLSGAVGEKPIWVWLVGSVAVGIVVAELASRRRLDPTWIPWSAAVGLSLAYRLLA